MSARLTVYANSNKPVPATYLEINGERIRDPFGNPYIVPADFNWETYMGKFEMLLLATAILSALFLRLDIGKAADYVPLGLGRKS